MSYDAITTILNRLDVEAQAEFGSDDFFGIPDDQIDIMVSAGLLIRSGRVTSIRCRLCDEGHPATVEYLEFPQDLLESAFYDCPSGGRDWLTEAQMRKWTGSRSALCKVVAACLGASASGRIVADCLYDIGRVEIGSVLRPAFILFGAGYRRKRQDLIRPEIADATRNAIILTLHSNVPRSMLVSAAGVLALQAVIGVQCSGLSADRQAIQRAIDMARTTSVSATNEQLNASDFSHSNDFRIVTLCGRRFELTEPQAEVVRRLIEARSSKDDCVPSNKLLDGVSEASEPKISNVFRSLPHWRELIARCKRRGSYRLNL